MGKSCATAFPVTTASTFDHASPSHVNFTITPVRTEVDLRAIVDLFTTYAASLNIDLSFQDFVTEMAELPGKYTPEQGGELLIARRTLHTTNEIEEGTSEHCGEPLGCVALRSLAVGTTSPTVDASSPPQPRICEMKRLYVTSQARGLGLGRALAVHTIYVADSMGYEEMRLDTLPTMTAAQSIYTQLGFIDIEPYRYNPVEGTKYLALRLGQSSSKTEKQ